MKIAVLAGKGASTNVLVNFLVNNVHFSELLVIVEDSPSKSKMIKHRARKVGVLSVTGQVLFILAAQPVLKFFSKGRIKEIRDAYQLDVTNIDQRINLNVNNINDQRVSQALVDFAPDIVLVNGTRIIKSHILSCGQFKFINTHAGITPMYRGVHGGYWSIWNKDEQNFGSTIHFVDAGVDTGDPLAFCRTKPSPKDTFVTYPLLQQAESLKSLKNILEIIRKNDEIPTSSSTVTFSKQWYHPTLWGYLLGLARGVK